MCRSRSRSRSRSRRSLFVCSVRGWEGNGRFCAGGGPTCPSWKRTTILTYYCLSRASRPILNLHKNETRGEGIPPTVSFPSSRLPKKSGITRRKKSKGLMPRHAAITKMGLIEYIFIIIPIRYYKYNYRN